LASADAALISLGTSLPGAVPSKIYEAMAAELPILLIADGEAARRVREAEAGLTSDPNDAATLKVNFLRLAGDVDLRTRLGAAGRRAAETIYDRARIADVLDEFLRERLST
jgi:glycosyltransferase involved in cell wall biosynthesis